MDKNTACLTSTLSAIGLHSSHPVVPKVIWEWYAGGLHQSRSKLVVEAQTTLHLLAPCFGSLLDLPETRTWRHLGSSPYVSGAAPKTKQHLSSCAQNAYTLCVSVFAEHFVLQCMWHLLLTCSAVAVYSLILMNTLCYHVCGISSEPSCKGSYRIKMYWK